jgi:hypothetical protein
MIESMDEEVEEDEEVAAAAVASVIESFQPLSLRSKASFAQQITTAVPRCEGFRPPSLHGVVDLLQHVPLAFFYSSGSYGTTNLERVAGRVLLRQHSFHANGCLGFAGAGSSMCGPCSAMDPRLLDRIMPYLYQPASSIPGKTNDAHFSAYQMKEKKDAIREEHGRKRLLVLSLNRKVHRRDRALDLHQRLMRALTKGSALESTCSFKLPGFKYAKFARRREEELQRRLALVGEAAVAAATEAGLGLGACAKAPRVTVQNHPIFCPIPGCKVLIWKLNLIPHLLEDGHPLPLDGRAQQWRRRGRAALQELQVLLTSSPRDKACALGEDVLKQVAEKLVEVRDLLAVAGESVSTTVSFCLEEVVRESQPALAKHYATRGPFKERATRKDKGKKKGEGEGCGGDRSAAAAGQGEESDGSEGSEDEEEEDGEEGGASGQPSGKRPADGEGPGSRGKEKKPKKAA